MSSNPFLVTIPHSGEKVPDSAVWLKNLPEEVLMCDVDRYVDRLYEPALKDLEIPYIKTEWHRYAGDLNRLPEDIDASTVIGCEKPAGQNSRGFLWGITTTEKVLMPAPVSADVHRSLVKLIYEPFHASIRDSYEILLKNSRGKLYHLDAHSMPSVGTRQHRDPGERRADIVVSDSHGKSCAKDYRDLVIAAYCAAGFKVGYNWPYFGGRLTEQYGNPSRGHHVLQVELNRDLYMDETTKRIKESHVEIQKKIRQALGYIHENLDHLGHR
ncbi:MAG TPA: N-formylglutamate amidohydrolase [Pseudobdellovibrionaceae bacterium]|nr:N-formylglutamate amidohydrolase [Pseudobdellovibrionaceae bacterium]